MNPLRMIAGLAARLRLVVIKTNHPSFRYLGLAPNSGFTYALHRTFPSLVGRRFIQVGANDGRLEDPLNQPIRQFGWTGTLIEPRGVFSAKLARLHAGQPGIRIVPAAIAEQRGHRKLFYIAPETPHLPDFAAGLATLDRTRIETACRDLGIASEQIREETVDAIRWQDLEPATPLAATEILVLDTEGYDTVLLRLWPWSTCRPAVVHFEHACVSPAEHQAMLGDLRGRGYEIVTDGGDTTAYISST